MAGSDNQALLLQLSADIRGLERSMDRANGVLDKGARQMERRGLSAARTIERSLGDIRLPPRLAREFNQLGDDIGRGLARSSQVAQVALLAVSATAIKLASDAAEIESAFDVAFKGAAASAREFSNVLSKKVGRDAVETRQAMTRLQLVLTGTGVAAQQATEIVKTLSEVGIDAASLFNTSDAEAFQKIISGLSGEAEPLKAFGVVINEAAVKTELLRLGFKGTASDASEAAKSVARANLIIKGLAVAQGDATRTAGSAANQQRALRAEFRAAARDLGEQLLPTYVKVVKASADLLRSFNELPGGVQVAGLAILAFIAAGGPIAGLLGGLSRVIKLAGEARVALAGVTGANAAVAASGAGAGIGGLAAGGIAAGGALAIPAVAGAVLADPNPRQFRKTVKEVDKATDEALAASINFARGNLARIAKSNAGAGADQLVKKLNADLGALTAEQAKRVAAKAGATPATPGAKPPGAGGFTLSPDQLKPRDGSDAKGKKGAAAPRDLNDERLAQVAAQVLASELDVLNARRALATTADERAKIERDIIDRTEAQENARLDGQIAQAKDAKGISDATRAILLKDLEALKLKTAEVASIERQIVHRELAEAKARDQLELQQTEFDGQEQLAQLQAGAARTAKERLAAELSLLDLAEQRAEAELDLIKATKGVASIEYQIAAQRLQNLRDVRPAREAEAGRQNRSPIEQFFDSLPRGADEINEAFQRVAAGGLADTIDGLAQVAAGMTSIEDFGRQMLQQLAYEVTRVNLQALLAKAFPGLSEAASGAQAATAITTAGSAAGGSMGAAITTSGATAAQGMGAAIVAAGSQAATAIAAAMASGGAAGGGASGALNFLKLASSFSGASSGSGFFFNNPAATVPFNFTLPAYASGTNSARGGLSLVGEHGPELVNLKRGAQVIPNDILRTLARGRAGPTITNRNVTQTLQMTVHANGAGDPATFRRTVSQASADAMRQMALAKRRGY